MPTNWSEYRLDGCVLEKERMAVPELGAVDSALPAKVDLREWCSPVEDQGPMGSCAANAVVGALEYLQIRTGLTTVDLSRLFVYYNARHLGECVDVDAGTCLSHVLAAVLAHGACEEHLWPNDPAKVTVKPSPDCYRNAARHQAIEFAMTPLGPPAMTALARGLPVVFTTYMPREYYDAAATTGRVSAPGAALGPADVGHCMLIVGYDMDEQTWIARNSWGTGWGEDGYLRIPFPTLQSYAVPEHFWVIGAISQTTGLNLTGPSMAQATADIAARAPGQMQARLRNLRTSLRAEIGDRLQKSRQDFRSRLRGE